MKTGVSKYGNTVLAVPAMTKDGHRVSIEFSVVLLKAPDGGVVGIAAILQDVTQRWERDKALRQRLAAAEAMASLQRQIVTAQIQQHGASINRVAGAEKTPHNGLIQVHSRPVNEEVARTSADF